MKSILGYQGPVVSRPYRYDRVKQGIIDYHIEKILQEGTIQPIQSPYASPVVLPRKNNGLPPDSPEAYRFAIDYRKLNAITKYPRYPLLVIDDLITNIPHTTMMSTLDLKSGYFQLAINPRDIEKTAFITRNDTFAFLRMPFGLSGAAPNIQKAIDIILKPVLGGFVNCYMDDVIITSPSFNEHIDHLNQAITEMKPSKNNKEVSKFLGMAGWYQKFIPNYADTCKPLYRLKKKGAKFNWSTEAQDSFDKIKRALSEAPVLQLPNFQEQFNLFTDASGVGIGAVLNQNHRSIAFASRTLNKTERNYTFTERECLVVIWALNKFWTYFGTLPMKESGRQCGSQISCAALRALALNSREQLIQEQREDPELGHIYRYLENPDDGSVNATVCEDLLGPYPASRPERYRFILVITDHFTKWSELMPLRKASAQAIAMALFENYISRYGAPISLINDNGPQFISDVFEHLSHRLDIKHIKTVTYRPQVNLTERVNRPMVHMIACFVEENHDNWDRFLHEFSFTLRTAVNEMTGKTPAELFLGRKIITPFRKLISVKDGAEYVGGNIEKLFEEARQNIRKQHKTWEKYYNRKRREEGPETIAGPSNQQQMRKFSPTKEESRRGTRVQSDKARETRTTGSKGHSAAEGRPVRSGKTTVRPCPYYLRNRFNEPEGIPGEQRSTGIDSLPQNSLRKRSLSMEALDGDPADRTT
ncbi:retrovirus-related Pol polyprotein from transposon 297 [Trichonephila clavipes]|nr:retrovirus-related Pol polyprotein from transposon 297 [Trichonephila clavipes]